MLSFSNFGDFSSSASCFLSTSHPRSYKLSTSHFLITLSVSQWLLQHSILQTGTLSHTYPATCFSLTLPLAAAILNIALHMLSLSDCPPHTASLLLFLLHCLSLTDCLPFFHNASSASYTMPPTERLSYTASVTKPLSYSLLHCFLHCLLPFVLPLSHYLSHTASHTLPLSHSLSHTASFTLPLSHYPSHIASLTLPLTHCLSHTTPHMLPLSHRFKTSIPPLIHTVMKN